MCFVADLFIDLLQMGIVFDRLYGWEMLPFDPAEFWSMVPPRWLTDYSFFNSPVEHAPGSRMNPLHMMRALGVEESDFVSFKLDIDTPQVEIPLVLQLNGSTELAQLVDEFFFELHFRCEFMRYCGWRYKMPEVFDGLRLDRPSALKLFSDLRHKGIRAHIWP